MSDVMKKPPDHLHTLLAIALRKRGLEWMPMGFMAAATWVGRQVVRAVNDELWQ